MLKKIKISKTVWEYIGYRAGWKKSILSKIIAKNSSLIKVAAVSNEEVTSAISNAIDMSGYGKGYILRANDDIMGVEEAKQRISSAFMVLYGRDKNFATQIDAYVSNKRQFSLSCYISVESGNKYLVPSFKGIGLSALKSVFTASLHAIVDLPKNSIEFALGEQNLRPINSLVDLVKMFNRAGFIVNNSTVEVGTIGSRSTNWDTSYKLNIHGANVPELLGALTSFTEIVNTDVSNQMATSEYNLTMMKEVRNLMARLGLGEVFNSAVKDIKKFEIDHNLKAIHNRYNKVPDYKNKTKLTTLKLSDYEELVFPALFEKAMKDFSGIINVKEPQELLSLAFSMGADNNLMSDVEVGQLIQVAA